MRTLKDVFSFNRKRAEEISQTQPEFFSKLAKDQTPKYFWIGCADSRVPASEVTGFQSGELFEHRNIANLVIHTDLSCLSSMQYAVEILGVKHIIVCGHSCCGGVKAVLDNQEHGLIDNWLRHVQDVIEKHEEILNACPTMEARYEMLCELNVIEQVYNACMTTVVQNAWRRGQELSVHGWIYELETGLLRDMGLCVKKRDELQPLYREAIINHCKNSAVDAQTEHIIP